MDLDVFILSEESQTENDKYVIYVNSKKIIQVTLFTKQKQTHRLRE